MSNKSKVRPIPKQKYLGPLTRSFKRLAKDLKYYGFPDGIEFDFITGEGPPYFEETLLGIIERRTIEDAEGYLAATVKEARTPDGVFVYRLDGFSYE